MASVLVKLDAVSRHYDTLKALDQISLEIRAGEWLSVMGPSGSGKSTLLNLLGALDRPTGGKLWVDGNELSAMSDGARVRFRREKVGIIFQQFHLLPYLTAVENVMVAQHYHSVADENEALMALDRVGLADRARHLPPQLSGGEQQRVCVARALVNRPRIILADEPTGNLDSKSGEEVIQLFQQLNDTGITMVLVTHEPDIANCCKRVIRFADGSLQSDEPMAERRIADPAKYAYLEAGAV